MTEQLNKRLAIGNVRLQRLADSYRQQGFFVLTNVDINHGVDIMVFTMQGVLVKAIEVTNYKASWEYICERTFNRYLTSLCTFDALKNVSKELVVSYDSNVTPSQKSLLFQSNISLIVVGKQDE